MVTIWKKYIPCEEKNTFLKCELYYSLGGYNYFTYKQEPRGYYLSVAPVEKSGIMESYVAFSGIKKLMVEVKRKSKKKESEAVEMIEKSLPELVDVVVSKNGIKVA